MLLMLLNMLQVQPTSPTCFPLNQLTCDFLFISFFLGSKTANQSNVPSMMLWWSWPLSVLSVMIPHWTIMRLVVNHLHVNR